LAGLRTSHNSGSITTKFIVANQKLSMVGNVLRLVQPSLAASAMPCASSVPRFQRCKIAVQRVAKGRDVAAQQGSSSAACCAKNK